MTLDLGHLAALEAAATPGEWREEHLGDMTRAHIFAGLREDCYHVAIVFPNEEGFWEAGRTHANAALIAALRNAAPALIAAAREREGLAAEVKRLNGIYLSAVHGRGEMRTGLRECRQQHKALKAQSDILETQRNTLVEEVLAMRRERDNICRAARALARAVRAQASAQAAATGSDSASWVDFVSADVLAALEGVGDDD